MHDSIKRRDVKVYLDGFAKPLQPIHQSLDVGLLLLRGEGGGSGNPTAQAILLLLAISSWSGVLPVVLIAMTGFFMGGVVPNITTAACSRLKSASGAASGVVNLSGGVGAILLPFTFGVVVLFSGAYWGFVLISSLAILVALIAN